MKRGAVLAGLGGLLIGALLLGGCLFGGKHRGKATSPGGTTTGVARSATAAKQAATNGAYQNISTNLSSERAANQAITKAATNSQSVGGAVNAPGGVSFGGGTGTGEHGAMFWFYVGLGIFFLVWLILAIWRRVHAREPAPARTEHRHVRGPPPERR